METPGFRSVLVALDGSAAADAALGLALRLVAPDGEVVIAHAIDRPKVVAECVSPYGGDPTPAFDALEADERDIFEKAGARSRAGKIRFSTVSLDGSPSACIASLARGRKVDAIAMGTHGRGGLARIFLGSTAAGVLHEVEVPTFVLHEQSAVTGDGPFRQIVVGLDASPAAGNAARAAVDLAARDDARVSFVHVAESRDEGGDVEKALAEARTYALTAGTRSENVVLHGDPVDAILISAEMVHADLIVLGAHARSLARFGMGSVAEAIVRTSPVPVLVLPISMPAATERYPVQAGGAKAR
jgi:nucleotide-binding universal stress UspA family protein